jgi:hypothetical protein
MKSREEIINNYIDGYNHFDIDKMVINFANTILFENISNGEINMSLSGLTAFKNQAELAKNYFTTRKQTIISFTHTVDETAIEIDYYAILNMDFPNGLKKGAELKLKGKSIFTFLNNKIIKLTDVS